MVVNSDSMYLVTASLQLLKKQPTELRFDSFSCSEEGMTEI